MATCRRVPPLEAGITAAPTVSACTKAHAGKTIAQGTRTTSSRLTPGRHHHPGHKTRPGLHIIAAYSRPPPACPRCRSMQPHHVAQGHGKKPIRISLAQNPPWWCAVQTAVHRPDRKMFQDQRRVRQSACDTRGMLRHAVSVSCNRSNCNWASSWTPIVSNFGQNRPAHGSGPVRERERGVRGRGDNPPGPPGKKIKGDNEPGPPLYSHWARYPLSPIGRVRRG